MNELLDPVRDLLTTIVNYLITQVAQPIASFFLGSWVGAATLVLVLAALAASAVILHAKFGRRS